jgi:hypothetical protein
VIYSFKCECGSTRELEQSIHAEIIEPICTDCHRLCTESGPRPLSPSRVKASIVTVDKALTPTGECYGEG